MDTNAEQTSTNDVSQSQDTSVSTDQTVTTGTDTGGAVEGGTTSAEETQNVADEGIVEKDGQQFIPYERFKQINEKFKEATGLLDSLNDPDKRQELLREWGVLKGQEEKQAPTDQQLTPFQKFLQTSVDPQYHEHYNGMAQAFVAEMKSYVDELMNPMMSYIGQARLKEIETKNPDFGQYQSKVLDLMKKHPSLDAEQAYILAAHADKLKQSQAAGEKREQDRLRQASRAPITRTPGSQPGVSANNRPLTRREALERAIQRMEQG